MGQASSSLSGASQHVTRQLSSSTPQKAAPATPKQQRRPLPTVKEIIQQLKELDKAESEDSMLDKILERPGIKQLKALFSGAVKVAGIVAAPGNWLMKQQLLLLAKIIRAADESDRITAALYQVLGPEATEAVKTYSEIIAFLLELIARNDELLDAIRPFFVRAFAHLLVKNTGMPSPVATVIAQVFWYLLQNSNSN